MNERIKELAEQVTGPSRLHGGDMALMGNKQIEKFAELIVLECAGFARAYTLKKSGIENPYTGAVFIENEIKKHFGIEVIII